MGGWIHRQALRIQKRRTPNTQMDLLKLYGIFCVVYAHCRNHGLTLWGCGVVSSVYVIQLFIFCSGYFYRTENDTAGLSYLARCAKAYLLPYFCWNLIYGLLRAGLAAAGLTSFGAPVSMHTLFVQPWTNAEQFLLNVPSWYLLSLFLVAMAVWAIRRAVSALHPWSWRLETALLVLLFALGGLAVGQAGQAQTHTGLDAALLRPLTLLPYYQLGIIYRKYRTRLPKHSEWGIIAGLAVLLVLLRLGNGGPFMTKMLYCYFDGRALLIVPAAAACVLLTAELCGLLAPLFASVRPVHYAGKCTMYIMLHHLLWLYLMQLGLYLWNRLRPLPGYSPEGFLTSIWYRYSFGRTWPLAVYLVLALLLPVALHYLYERILLRLDGNGA